MATRKLVLVSKTSGSKKRSLRQAIFPGSFDPFTNGHLDIVERSLHIFDRVTVGVLNNPAKNQLFSVEERVSLTQQVVKQFGIRVEVKSFSGLLVTFCREQRAEAIVRGLRAISDFDYEAQMALMNRKLDSGIETFFLMTREENSYISSTVVKQVAQFSGDISHMVPAVVFKALEDRFRR